MPSPFTNWMPSWPSGFIFDTVAALLGDERDLARRDEDPERARRKPKTPLQWIPVAWACIDLLTNELSGFPFTAYRRTYVEGYERPIKIPVKPDSKYGRLADMLTTDPCDQMNADLFWRHAWWMTLATGNNYALMHRNERNEVVNLEPVTRITPPQSYPSMPLRMKPYRFHEYPYAEWPRRNVLAMHGPGYNARMDVSPSPFLVAAKNLGFLDEGLTELVAALRDPRNLYSITSDIAEEAAELAAVATEQLIDAAKNDYDPVLVNAEVHRRQAGTSVRTINRTEDFRWAAEEAMRVWGVPARSAGLLSVGMRTEAPIMSQRADLATRALNPRAKMMKAAIIERMLTGTDRAGGYRVTLDVNAELAGTLKERAEVAEMLVSRGGLWTPNEGRVLTGKPPKDDDPEADKRLDPKGGPDQGSGSDGDRKSPGTAS